MDKRLVGQVAAEIRAFRGPEPYKGKGVRTRTSRSGARKARRSEAMAKPADRFEQRRRERLRFQLRQKAGGRPRLSVFRSGKHIYAQVIDDAQGRTLAAASSLDKTLRAELKTGADKAAAAAVGKLVAERAMAAGRQGGGVRPRRLSVSRPRQGAGRRRPRGRAGVLRTMQHGT